MPIDRRRTRLMAHLAFVSLACGGKLSDVAEVGAGGALSATAAHSAGGVANAGGRSWDFAGGGSINGTSSGAAGTASGVWITIDVDAFPGSSLEPASTRVLFYAYDPPPLPESYSVVAEIGACKLLLPTYPDCSEQPWCAGRWCVGVATCFDLPVLQDIGSVSISGLTRNSDGGNLIQHYTNADYYSSDLAYPPCNPGEPVSVTGGADPSTAFALETACIEPLVLQVPDPLPLDIQSRRSRYVTFPGLISCMANSECPVGQRCGPYLTCARSS